MNFKLALHGFCLIFSNLVYSESMDDLLKNYHPHITNNKKGDKLLYRTASPEKMNKEKTYPMLIFLHGAGGRGSDNMEQLLDAGGIQAFEKAGVRTKFKSHLFAAQVPKGERWVNVHWSLLGHKMPKISDSMRMAFKILDAYIEDPENQVDSKRIYIMGLSMGGYGTWDAIQRRPNFFAAAVPICGGGDTSLASKLIDLPIWAWHGDQDKVIKPSRSRDMINAIKKIGGTPKYSEIKGRGHNSWVDCWNSNELWEWLYSNSKN
ncbi:MAG: prolyl oligopeptidase family serine peptidase [Verrucomicrobiota bacterium]|nr:prolyl oligopeptidase family serine peptidase [Verrucomicrobiota bacterium]